MSRKKAKSWRRRVDEAKKRDSFTADDREAAQRWESCAIGERRKFFIAQGYKFLGGGTPANKQLIELGVLFNDVVKWDCVKEADRLLETIRLLSLEQPSH